MCSSLTKYMQQRSWRISRASFFTNCIVHAIHDQKSSLNHCHGTNFDLKQSSHLPAHCVNHAWYTVSSIQWKFAKWSWKVEGHPFLSGWRRTKNLTTFCQAYAGSMKKSIMTYHRISTQKGWLALHLRKEWERKRLKRANRYDDSICEEWAPFFARWQHFYQRQWN